MLRTRLTLSPGQPGTRKLVEEYGARVVCVRYRYDDVEKKRYKTVELIVEEVQWVPRPRKPAATDIVHVSIKYQETATRNAIKLFGGTWHPPTRTWRLAYGAAVALHLTDRITTLPTPPPSTNPTTPHLPADTQRDAPPVDSAGTSKEGGREGAK